MKIRLPFTSPYTSLLDATAGSPHFQHADRRPAAFASGRRPLSLLDRLDAWLWRQHQRELERSLADSGDIFEIERRVQHGESRLFARYT